jgi:hypothetical protein
VLATAQPLASVPGGDHERAAGSTRGRAGATALTALAALTALTALTAFTAFTGAITTVRGWRTPPLSTCVRAITRAPLTGERPRS